MLALTLAVPAFALEESDVEAAVSSSSREAVTGNVLVWFLCAVGFLKVSQKIDSFMASIGVNVGHTGGSMLGEAMVAFKGVSLAAGMAGKVVGNFADRASSRAGAAASGSSGFLQGGLAGVVSRKITNDAVRTATQTTQKASSSTMSAAHQATERTVNAERQAASVVHQAKQTRSESASKKSQTGVTHQQIASSTRTASVSSLRRESQHSVGLGGRIFTNSMLEGGRFANDVIGMVAAGDLHSTGSITGEFASQALSSYMGITAQGDAAPQISYSGIEIGGGRITGTEYSPEHPEGISFGMYHTIQPLIYRLVCSNGMVINDAKTRRNHVGRAATSEEDFSIYSNETLLADDHAFVLKIKDTVRAAISEARFAQVVSRMRESTEAMLDTKQLPAIVKLASSSFGITEDESNGVLEHLITGGDFSLYGLANAVTRFSQDVESYDRATKLEEIGYSVMTMSPALFRQMNQTELLAA